jgi:hypothetical protein
MSELHTETLLVAGYVGFLAVAALGIDLLARGSHARSFRYRTAGFTYRHHLDAWECPEGERLHLHELDRERRVARYRAPARACNACPAKAGCTDSDRGREIAAPLDPWPHSEAGRFHRGIALVLLALALVLIVVGAGLHPEPADAAILLAEGIVITAILARMAAAFRAAPAVFPPGTPMRTPE